MLPANGPEACHLRTIDDTLLIYSENSFRAYHFGAASTE